MVVNPPSRDEFDAWAGHHVTRFVLAALERAAQAQEAEWQHWSWEMGKADQGQLNALRTRADAYRGIAEAGYDGIVEWAGDEKG